MANTYSWKINSLDCYVSKNDLDYVAHHIHWTFKGQDQNGVMSQINGVQVLEDPDPSTFTPFSDLDEATVISWLESAISDEDLEIMKSNIDKEISDQIAPSKFNISLGADPELILNPNTTEVLDSNDDPAANPESGSTDTEETV
jgi:hypothetical protein